MDKNVRAAAMAYNVGKVKKENKRVGKKIKVPIPSYSLGEELFNSISHGIGALLSVVALTVGVVFSVLYSDVWCVISVAVYGTCLFLLYIMSTLYHALGNNKAKKVFRVFDHCSIFLLIAGTYTPFTLVTLRNEGAWGWVLFSVVWGAAIVGIVLNAINLNKYKVVSMICYIAMGWAMIVAAGPFLRVFSFPGGLALLLAGGLFYTLGAVIYAFGKRKKYMHSVWHLFALAGSILHFFCILFFIIL